MWISRGGWKKYQKLIVRGVGIVGGWKNLKILVSGERWGWLFNCFFLSFSNHENYIIKNICVYSKSRTKTKITSKQNLEHFKMINRRLFIHKFCNNSKMLLSSSWAIFIRALMFALHQGPTFLRFSTCVFCFY